METWLPNVLKFGELGLLGLFGFGMFRLLMPVAQAAAKAVEAAGQAAVAWFENQIQSSQHLIETSIEGFARLFVLMENLNREVKEYTDLLKIKNGKK